MSDDRPPRPPASSAELPFKLAFRVEGDFVMAYLAAPVMYADPNRPPLLIASFKETALRKTPGVYEEWRGLVRRVIEQMCADLGWPAPNWHEMRAPESERTGGA